MFIPEQQLYMCPYKNCKHNEWQNAFSDQDWCNMHNLSLQDRCGSFRCSLPGSTGRPAAFTVTGSYWTRTVSDRFTCEKSWSSPGGSGFTPLALPVPQSLPCLPHNMSGVEASHFMTFLWLHACWKPE